MECVNISLSMTLVKLIPKLSVEILSDSLASISAIAELNNFPANVHQTALPSKSKSNVVLPTSTHPNSSHTVVNNSLARVERETGASPELRI